MALVMRERGSLRSGLGEWIVQRVTAVYILLYLLAMLLTQALSPIQEHADWLKLSDNMLFRVTSLLFIVSLLAHSWVGLKSVFLDYVKPTGLRFIMLMLLAVAISGLVIWALLVISKL